MKQNNIFLLRFSLKFNGPGRLLLATAIETMKFGWNPIVITGNGNECTDVFADHRITVKTIRTNPLGMFLDIISLALKYRPSVIHSFSYSGALVCELLSRVGLADKILFTVNGYGREVFLKLLKNTRIIAPSNFMKARLERVAGIRCNVLYPCSPEQVKTEKKIAGKLKARRCAPEGQIIIGTLVRDIDLKGIPFFIQTLALLKTYGMQVRGIIAGSKPDRYRGLIRYLGMKNDLEFPGVVSDVGGFFRKLDIYSQFSLIESFGISVLEAMIFGVPAVISDIESFNEIAGDNAALFFSPRGVIEAATRICDLVDNGDLYDSIRKEGLHRAEQIFCAEVFALELQKLYFKENT